MNQLLVVNKPAGYTSRDIINKLSKIFNYKKIGHTGTLDPIASGVLVCLFGKYTRLGNLITALDKEYIAKIKLGIKTDTLDITGNIIEENSKKITKEEIIKVLNEFPKSYNQTVPKYSAVRINGKRLYEYARENIDIKLPTRTVNIYNLELIDFKDDEITFKASVSKGTYIRSLIDDICKKLNTVGTMKELTRTKQGSFDIKDSYTIDEIINNKFKFQNIHEFLDYPEINISDKYLKLVLNGAKIPNIFNIKDKVIFKHENKDIAIYENINETLKPYVMF